MPQTITDHSLTPGLPARYFTDADIHQRVKREIYFKSWQYACHRSQVACAGQYFTFSIFDQDIAVVCGADGKLRALYNVCQHRGHRLLEGQGITGRIVCPYHAWTYGLDGQLLAAPNSRSVPGFNASDICVPQVQIEEFLGFIFVSLDESAPPMDEVYPGVKDAMLNLCPDIELHVFAHEHSAEEGCNWLTAVENYNECYHCRVAHPDFAVGVIDPDSYRVAPFGGGKVLRHTSRATQSADAWYDVSGSDYGSFFMWPSTSIQIYPRGVVNSYHWRPLAVDDVRVHRGWYSHDGEVDAALQRVIDLDRETTFAEDLRLVRNVQRGLQSRGYRPGPLIIDPQGSIESELSVACLHQWLQEAVDN